jgi:hypothetical protein
MRKEVRIHVARHDAELSLMGWSMKNEVEIVLMRCEMFVTVIL